MMPSLSVDVKVRARPAMRVHSFANTVADQTTILPALAAAVDELREAIIADQTALLALSANVRATLLAVYTNADGCHSARTQPRRSAI
jgi:hypothetical protein